MAESVKAKLRTTSRSSNRVQPQPTTVTSEPDGSILDSFVLNVTEQQQQHSSEQPTTWKDPITGKPHIEQNKDIVEGCERASKCDYQGAIKCFELIIPQTSESLDYCGYAHLHMGGRSNISTAINYFNEALSLEKEKIRSNIYYKRAFAYHSIGQYTDAIIDYTSFIESDKKEAHKGYLGRGLVYGSLHEYKQALKDIKKANEEALDASPYYRYCLGRAYANCEEQKASRNVYEEILSKVIPNMPSSASRFLWNFDRGIAFYQLDRYQNALESFEEALKHEHTPVQKAETYLYMGLAHKGLSRPENAKKYLEMARNSNRDDGRAHFHLALIYADRDETWENALESFTHAHTLNPHNSDVLYERGELRYKMGQLEGCVSDKRKALQLEHSTRESALTIEQYKLLLERYLSLSQSKQRKEVPTLTLAWLQDQISTVALEQKKKSMSDEFYHKAMHTYQKTLELKKEQDYVDLLSFALMFNLSKDGKRVVNAMIAWDQFIEIMERSDKHAEIFNNILAIIQNNAQTRIYDSSNEDIGELWQRIIALENSPNTTELIDENLLHLLAAKLKPLLKINDSRQKIQEDMDALANEKNNNLQIFYKKMRVTLSHTFAAMALTSGVGEEAIIRHDRTGTQKLIGDAVTTLGGFIGGLMPNYGGVVSAVTSFAGDQIKEHEHQRFQDRMSIIASVGDVQELNDIARQVARILATRYQEQLLALKSHPKKNSCACCFCCLPACSCCCCSCCSDGEPRTDTKAMTLAKPLEVVKSDATKQDKDHPTWQVAQFGVDCLIGSILNTEPDHLKLEEGMEADKLINVIVEMICGTKPAFVARVRRTFKIEGKNSIPHGFVDIDGKEILEKWHLHDFYYKPGIRWNTNDSTVFMKKQTSWMDPKVYGYRSGTEEEYRALEDLDKKTVEKKSCCC